MKYALPENAKLHTQARNEVCSLYEYEQEGLANRYYVASTAASCRLMAEPEMIGIACKQALVPSTRFALDYLLKDQPDSRLHIFNILRGALNFPLEESASEAGMYVRTTDFVTCERVIKDGVIRGLDIKYEKLLPERDVTVLIGDIIASGETLKQCMPLIANRFSECGGSIRRVVFFTIGGSKAINMLEHLTVEFRKVWPEFEGFDCVFYEGIFTVYEDKGVTGVNTPDIDFGWQCGALAPEFRHYIMEHPLSLLEKCIIYDGGARRFEIPGHIAEVTEYWESLHEAASASSFADFVAEKVGYALPLTYDQWLSVTHLDDSQDAYRPLYEQEVSVHTSLVAQYADRFATLCHDRLEAFIDTMQQYR